MQVRRGAVRCWAGGQRGTAQRCCRGLRKCAVGDLVRMRCWTAQGRIVRLHTGADTCVKRGVTYVRGAGMYATRGIACLTRGVTPICSGRWYICNRDVADVTGVVAYVMWGVTYATGAGTYVTRGVTHVTAASMCVSTGFEYAMGGVANVIGAGAYVTKGVMSRGLVRI